MSTDRRALAVWFLVVSAVVALCILEHWYLYWR
jgi:hypothetical protein